jgi:molybdopterin-guanine dinucleotide biosynthesis protein A
MGGKSSRMGVDKSQLHVGLRYNSAEGRITQTDKEQDTSAEGRRTQTDKEQTFAELAHSKLKPYVDEVHYSINKNQENLGLEHTILDEYEGEGPLSGIISTKKSILILGVDMPLITTQSIETLIKQRNWDLLTTTYYNDQSNKWEPMLSIWEIETLPCLEEYFDNGGRSIQEFLNQYGNQQVIISSEQEFTNVNTTEDLKKVRLS